MQIKKLKLEIHLPFCALMTLQFTLHDQLSIWVWTAWQAAQFTNEFPVDSVWTPSTTTIIIIAK